MSWTKEKAKQYARDWYKANRIEQLRRAKDRKKNNPEARRIIWRRSRLKQYGLSLEEYQILLEAQNGNCAICKQPPDSRPKRMLFVDHCHATGRVRGLLCSFCNSIIGFAEEKQITLLSAIEYLKR